MSHSLFQQAKPIWIKNRSLEMNVGLYFQYTLKDGAKHSYHLAIAGHTLYKIKIDGKTIYFGPARCNHHTFKVETIGLSKFCELKDALLEIEVFGYNVNGYAYIKDSSFIQFEISKNNSIIFATSSKNSDSHFYQTQKRVQKVQKYSYQRAFIEAYQQNAPCINCELEQVTEKKLITSDVPYSNLFFTHAKQETKLGEFYIKPDANLWQNRALDQVNEAILGYKKQELTICISDIISKIKFNKSHIDIQENISKNQFLQYEFQINSTGFLGISLEVLEDSAFVVLFDEILSEEQVDPFRLNCCNAIYYEVQKGCYQLESFEPYTIKYAQFVLLKGKTTKPKLSMLHLNYFNRNALKLETSDSILQTILDATHNTFCQNVVDLPMDCPSRERAGWLCDSYFTGIAESWFDEQRTIEKAFLYNIARAKDFAHIPIGMIPMNYPSDQFNGRFIPNWSLWYVVEIGEYYDKTREVALLQASKEKILALFDYFKKFLNSEQLLENLDGEIFVEWSMANKLTKGVNFPTNMLYAKALEVAAKLYQQPKLQMQAEKTKASILKFSYDGVFFRDQAIRNENKLEVQPACTEVCQYYAYFFNLITPISHSELWQKLIERNQETTKQLHVMNVLPGYVLRLFLLGQHGYLENQLKEIKMLYSSMAQTTGTLWEMSDKKASLNHGFNSILLHFYMQDQLGLTINLLEKTIQWKPPLTIADKGHAQLLNGKVLFKWEKQEREITYTLKRAEGFNWMPIAENFILKERDVS